MPILNIEVIGPLNESIRSGLASRIADAAGKVLNSKPQSTWVKIRFLSEEEYSENEGGPAEAVLPVFISLILAKPPAGNELNKMLYRLTEVIAKVCERPPQNVHIIVEPAAAGRIAFGGSLIDK